MRALRERVVVITGAAGGIGRALSVAFAQEGSALALVDLDASGLEVVRRDVLALGTEASLHTADVSDRQALERVREDVLSRHGRVDVLVNNAGVTVYSLFEQLEPEEFERIVAVNFWGVVYGCEIFLPALRRSGGGHIVNVASMSGFAGMPFQSPYCATKFAVRGFTEALRAELDNVGIGVTCVMPGVTSSQILASARSRDPALSGRLGQLQLRHGGSPDKLARRIIRGVRHNQAEVRGQFDSILLDLTKRAFPWLVGWFMAQLVRAASRRGLVRARP